MDDRFISSLGANFPRRVVEFKETCAIKGDILLWSTLVLKRTDQVESDAQIICTLPKSNETALSNPIFMTIPPFHFLCVNV